MATYCIRSLILSFIAYIPACIVMSDSLKPNHLNFRVSLIQVSHAWIREPFILPQVLSNKNIANKENKVLDRMELHAGYFTLSNSEKDPKKLIKIESPDYLRVEMHTMIHKNGIMKMKKMNSLTIPSNGKVVLEPRKKHLMLIQPNRSIRLGMLIPLTLYFDDKTKLSIYIPVKSMKKKASNNHHH
jgi:copper(I)-binding protein